MRLGAVWLVSANAHYRAIDPLKAMERRGHEVVWPTDPVGTPDVRRLASCDLVHVYRRADDGIRSALTQLARSGVPFTYDNDDNFAVSPKEAPVARKQSPLTGQRYFTATVKVARMASATTVPSEALAATYRRAGVAHVDVIENYLAVDARRPRNRHPGVVIGWIAAAEHRAEVARLPLRRDLERLLAKHPDARVECIGVDLELPERYRHDVDVPFRELPRRIAGFDVGIAPLADIPWNRARSNIKVKEYAASGVPWVASPVGPYRGLGEEHGGLLIPDDGWFGALDRLVSHRRERKRLARKAKAWARGETIESAADRWEQHFALATRPADRPPRQ